MRRAAARGAFDAGAFSDKPSTKTAAADLLEFGDGGRALVVLVEGEENAACSASATSTASPCCPPTPSASPT